eukprot:403341879
MTQEADSQNDKILIKMNSKQKFRSLKNSRDRSIKIGDKVFKDRYDDYGQDFIDQTRNISRKKLYLNGSQKKLSFDQQQIEEIRQTQIEEYTNNLFQLAPFNRKNLDQLIPDQQQSHRKSRASKKRYDGIDNEKSLNRDSSQKSSLQQYYNPTSPGDYNLPNLIGRETQSKSKAPAYSFGSKYSIKQVISSQHKQDLVGSDSPGVGYYKNSDKLIVEKSQRDHLNKSDLQFGTSPRFFEFQNQLMLKKKLPLQYEEEDQNSINKKTNQSQLKSILNDKDLVINQDKRMPYGLKDQKKFDSPGPGSYQTFQSSLPISKNGSQRSLEIVKSLRQQQERFEITKKTFHREWKTDQIGQESKGPGQGAFENKQKFLSKSCFI